MGAAHGSHVRLSPQLSLKALGLTPESSLDDALRALLRAREDLVPPAASSKAAAGSGDGELRQRRGGKKDKEAGDGAGAAWAQPLPPQEQLLVLACGGSFPGGEDGCVLGGEAAQASGVRALRDLGFVDEPAEEGAAPPRLGLAVAAAGGGTLREGLLRRGRGLYRGYCRGCCRRNGRVRGGCRRGADWCWDKLPERFQERLKPALKTGGFYLMCGKWALAWVWEERYELLDEGRAMLGDALDAEGPPPCAAQKVQEELRPFGYALCAGVIYAAWDVGGSLLLGAGPPADGALGPGSTEL